MAKVPKNGTCALCAATDVELTIEHVFPESWYPDEHPRAEMLTAPSCEPCNHELGKAEARLFFPLVAILPSTEPRTRSMRARALRGIDTRAARSARDAEHRARRGAGLARQVAPRDPNQTRGVLWTPERTDAPRSEAEPPEFTIPIPWNELEAVAIKFLRCCYYEHTGRPLPSGSSHWVRTFDSDPGPSWERFHSRPEAIRRGVFPFEYSLVVDAHRRDAAAGTFLLWGAVHLLATANVREP